MNRLAWCILIAALALAWAIAYHAPPPDIGPLAERVARTYDVGDLLDLPPDRDDPSLIDIRLGRGGNDTPKPPTALEARLAELTDQIRFCIDPDGWTSPGPNSITTFGRRLVVVQTRQNQQAVRTLLDDLRAFPPRQVRVDMVWARLTPAELDALAPAPAPSPVRTVDLAALERTPAAVAYRGQSTCITGRRARVTSGRARTAVVGVDAVVGNDFSAFEPRARNLLDGATIDVVPSLSPDGQTVLLDVRAELTRFGPEPRPPIEVPAPVTPGGASAKSLLIDRLNLGVQSIQTSARGPANTGIVMAETADPDAPPGQRPDHRLYLIVRAAEWKDVNRQQKP